MVPVLSCNREAVNLPTVLAGKVMRSVVSVRLLPLYLFNQPSSDLDFYTYMGHGHSSPGIGGQGHRSRLRFKVRISKSSCLPVLPIPGPAVFFSFHLSFSPHALLLGTGR